jgi:hypothetical protein
MISFYKFGPGHNGDSDGLQRHAAKSYRKHPAEAPAFTARLEGTRSSKGVAAP